MADQASTSVKDLVDRVLEAQKQEQIAQRGRELVASMSEAAGHASRRAAEAWRDSASLRRETAKTVARAGREATSWGRRTWQRDLAPSLRDLVGKRVLAFGAAGAAAPAVSELVGDTAARFGIGRRRESRRWGAFFLGLLVGAAAGVVAALLTAPKAGRQMRDELTITAREAAGKAKEAALQARDELTVTAREAAGKAKEAALQARDVAVDAAATASDWMPIFQRSSIEEVAAEPIIEEVPPTPAIKTTKTRVQPEAPTAD